MSEKNKKDSLNPIVYANGKTGGQCYKDYITWKEKNDSGNYIEYLVKNENLAESDAKEIALKMETRYKNNTSKDKSNKKNKNGSNKKEKSNNKKKNKLGPKDKKMSPKDLNALNKMQKEAEKAREGSPSKKKLYRDLNKEFNRYLIKNNLDTTRRSADIGDIHEKFLAESKMSDNTKAAHRSAFNYMQENVYQKNTKGNKVKKTIREINRVRMNTLNNIVVPPEKHNVFEQNLNHIDKTFRNFFSKDSKGRQCYFKERGLLVLYTKWYMMENGGTYIKNSKDEDFVKFFEWQDKQGYKTETKNRYATGLRKYANAGNWDAKPPEKNKDLGIERRINNVMDRAWRGHEFEKAFNLAVNGTGKKGGCKRPDVALYLLTCRVFSERTDECINMTLDQFKAAVEDEKLHLTKTKNNTPRDVPIKLINKCYEENKQLLQLFNPLIRECERLGIEKPFIELWDRHDGKKVHNIRQTYGKWVNRHRDKFQDEDRKDKHTVFMNNKGKKRSKIEIEKIEITPHGLRHAGAQQNFELICDYLEKSCKNDELQAKRYLKEYREYKENLAKKRGWKFKWDAEKEAEYLKEAIIRKSATIVSESLGHHRSSVTKLYLTRKKADNATVFIDINNLEQMHTIYEEKVID